MSNKGIKAQGTKAEVMEKFIINNEINENQNLALFKAFSIIKLDIEGSNLSNTGWMPTSKDKSFMGEEQYQNAIKECNETNAKVLFTNVFLSWDSCDCGDGYGCSHGSYVYEINIFHEGKNINIDVTDGDSLEFYHNGNYCKIPTADCTIYDFIRMCQICELDLELSDYAFSLLTP